IRVQRVNGSNNALAVLKRNASGTCDARSHPVGEEVHLSEPAAVFYGNQLPPTAGNYRSGVWHEDNGDGRDGTAWGGSDQNVHLRGVYADLVVRGVGVGSYQSRHVVTAFFSERASTWLDHVKCEAVWHGFDFEDYVDQSGGNRTVFTTRRDYV